MSEFTSIPIYEIPAPGWVSGSFLRLLEQRRRPPRRVLAGVAGVVISVLAHVALIGSVVWSASARQVRPPERRGAGASAVISEAEPAMTLALINASRLSDPSDPPDQQSGSRGPAPRDLPILLESPDPTPAFDLKQLEVRFDAAEPAAPAAEASAARALLYGRYLGQIEARIERAWLRPRTAIEGGSFDCRVEIVQNRFGAVEQTTLQRCNGDTRWQLSLVQAIQSASPLPAPPDPQVFVDALTLEFKSGTYRAGVSAEGFEPDRRMAAASAISRDAHWIQRPARSAADGKSGSEVLELRITGPAPAPAVAAPAAPAITTIDQAAEQTPAPQAAATEP